MQLCTRHSAVQLRQGRERQSCALLSDYLAPSREVLHLPPTSGQTRGDSHLSSGDCWPLQVEQHGGLRGQLLPAQQQEKRLGPADVSSSRHPP